MGWRLTYLISDCFAGAGDGLARVSLLGGSIAVARGDLAGAGALTLPDCSLCCWCESWPCWGDGMSLLGGLGLYGNCGQAGI